MDYLILAGRRAGVRLQRGGEYMGAEISPRMYMDFILHVDGTAHNIQPAIRRTQKLLLIYLPKHSTALGLVVDVPETERPHNPNNQVII